MQEVWRNFIEKILTDMEAHALRPNKVVVLLPFAQHIPLAKQAWSDCVFALPEAGVAESAILQECRAMLPRFTTTKLWSMDLPPVATAASTSASISGSTSRAASFASSALQRVPARDLLAAEQRLQQAQKDVEFAILATIPAGDLTAQLLARAYSLADAAAATPPQERQSWYAKQLALLGGVHAVDQLDWQMVEGALNALALNWVATSTYSTDNLFGLAPQKPGEVQNAFERLWVFQSAQFDGLTEALQTWYAERVQVFSWRQEHEGECTGAYADVKRTSASPQIEACLDMEREAVLATAAVIAHIEQGRTPVALIAQDRLATRRIAAMLRQKGLNESDIHDETGWQLSTTRAAAGLMALLRFAAPQAKTDELMEWLKLSPRWMGGGLDALEQGMRRETEGQNSAIGSTLGGGIGGGLGGLGGLRKAADARIWLRRQAKYKEISGLLDWVVECFSGQKPLPQWLELLQEGLQKSGQWTVFQSDRGGRDCVRVLHFKERDSLPNIKMSLAQFSKWVGAVLEAERFRFGESVDAAQPARVRILPLAQLVGRDFAAVVMPGCDAQSFPLAPSSDVWWTPAQRLSLGLPTIEMQVEAQMRLWQALLAFPRVTLLYRTHSGADPVGKSPLLAQLMWQQLCAKQGENWTQDDTTKVALQSRCIVPNATPPAQPSVPGYVVDRISPSQYQLLRDCPYQFYARRVLGLSELVEWQNASPQKDWGLWVHAVLQRFHERRTESLGREDSLALLDEVAEQLRTELRISGSEFLAYFSGWLGLREDYLDWLEGHEAAGWRFGGAELTRERNYQGIVFKGKIDRLDYHKTDTEADTVADTPTGVVKNTAMLIDYKTESDEKTKKRVSKNASEDIQLAFYAALHQDVSAAQYALEPSHVARGAYLNIYAKATQRSSAGSGVQAMELKNLTPMAAQLVDAVVGDSARIYEGEALQALGEGAVCSYCAVRGLCRRDFWK